MRKTGIACALLFSFLMVMNSCAEQGSDYSDLAAKGAYGQILVESSKRFAKDHSLDELLWMAISYHESGYPEHALQALQLYFDLAPEDAIVIEARRLALQIPLEGSVVVEQAAVLDALGALDEQLATAYYQALLAQGSQSQANDVFVRYLSHSIDRYTYAEILVRSHAELTLLAPVLAALSVGDRILLVSGASLDENGPQRAAELAAMIETLEDEALNEASRQLLYEALWRLYTQADMRVLANKYRSLAQIGQ